MQSIRTEDGDVVNYRYFHNEPRRLQITFASKIHLKRIFDEYLRKLLRHFGGVLKLKFWIGYEEGTGGQEQK